MPVYIMGGWRSEAMGGGEYHSYPGFGWPDLAKDERRARALALAALATATWRAARAALALGALAAATWRAAHPQRCCSRRGGATAEVGARACGSRKQLRRRAREREVAQKVSLGIVRKFHSGSLGIAEKVSLSAGRCCSSCSCGPRGRSLQRLRPCSRRRGSLPRFR